MQETQRRERAPQLVVEIARRQPEVDRHGAMQDAAERQHGVVVGQQRLPKPRHVGPEIGAAERLVGQHLGIVRREIEPDVEGFLVVGTPSGIERLDRETHVAAIVAGARHRDRRLDGLWRREEAPRAREHLVAQPGRHGRMADVEEADRAAGLPDLARHRGEPLRDPGREPGGR